MKIKFLLLSLTTSLVFGITGCMKSNESQDEEKIIENVAAIEAFINSDSQGSSAIKDTTGFYYINRVSNPSGITPKLGDAASVNINAYLLNGTQVISYDDDSLFTFTVGAYNTGFYGLDLGVTKMKTGEKTTFLLPYYLAFGSANQTNIPGYSPIRMELELIKTRTEEQQIDDFVAKKQFVVSEKTTNGLVIIRTNEVLGDAIGAGKSVSVKYVGKFLNGTTFDSGTFPFTTGTNATVAGFDTAISKMRKGEKAIIIFPSSLGYGASGSSSIPGYTPLYFEVEVAQ
jgi:FKBP-type peptidyl-prolyl cis-trans isomerase